MADKKAAYSNIKGLYYAKALQDAVEASDLKEVTNEARKQAFDATTKAFEGGIPTKGINKRGLEYKLAKIRDERHVSNARTDYGKDQGLNVKNATVFVDKRTKQPGLAISLEKDRAHALEQGQAFGGQIIPGRVTKDGRRLTRVFLNKDASIKLAENNGLTTEEAIKVLSENVGSKENVAGLLTKDGDAPTLVATTYKDSARETQANVSTFEKASFTYSAEKDAKIADATKSVSKKSNDYIAARNEFEPKEVAKVSDVEVDVDDVDIPY